MEADLVLAPGLLCDHAIWARQVEGLAATATIQVAAYGQASRLEDMAERVLRDAPPKFSLAGHSMGARVALEVVRKAPERVARLALLDTGVHGPRPGEAEQRGRLLALAREAGMNALCEAWLAPMVHPSRRGDEAFMEPLRDMVRRFSVETFAAQIAALLRRPDPCSVLAGFARPLLVGVGRDDDWSPPAQHETILRLAPGAVFVIFEHSGHMAPYEAPEAVNAALEAWLSAE